MPDLHRRLDRMRDLAETLHQEVLESRIELAWMRDDRLTDQEFIAKLTAEDEVRTIAQHLGIQEAPDGQ
ncbi:hypothetical protein GCM10010399_44280 [Dactylosporangium fulvum]|uniref:Uncharacterized protein n=1 Tax=Dactylosporangium fulvum TaxID=53359 RepID=A0ABY5WA51_9ACTN|nr:hypothetical protein [Dactylosporangium fulvum]UWP85904.1 hypothetical protein Dfulv_17295 [Dactylosporangium fulvum]